MATNNALNKKTAELIVDPGASGDSFVQFDINGTGEFRVGVDDTDDSFRISQGSALGTNDTFVMTASGERTMPLQSAFLAYLGTTDSNATGDGTKFSIGTGNALTEVFDLNGDFNTNGTYTAPVDGVYHIFGWVRYSGLTASHNDGQITIGTPAASFFGGEYDSASIRNSSDIVAISVCHIEKLDAGDAVIFSITIKNGTKVVDVVGSSTIGTGMAGFLAC